MQRREVHSGRRSPGSAHCPRLELLVEITRRVGLGGVGEIHLFRDFQHVFGEFIVLVDLCKVDRSFCRESLLVLVPLLRIFGILGVLGIGIGIGSSVSGSSSIKAPAGAPMPNKAVSSSSS